MPLKADTFGDRLAHHESQKRARHSGRPLCGIYPKLGAGRRAPRSSRTAEGILQRIAVADERKSVEPMAARLAPDNVRQMHQSMHHLVADATWEDEILLRRVREEVLPAMIQEASVEAWVIDDTGFPKKGTHSVGVAHQYCGQLGKSDNCQVAVSLSVTTRHSSLPIAWQLYLPQEWGARSEKTRESRCTPKTLGFKPNRRWP